VKKKKKKVEKKNKLGQTEFEKNKTKKPKKQTSVDLAQSLFSANFKSPFGKWIQTQIERIETNKNQKIQKKIQKQYEKNKRYEI